MCRSLDWRKREHKSYQLYQMVERLSGMNKLLTLGGVAREPLVDAKLNWPHDRFCRLKVLTSLPYLPLWRKTVWWYSCSQFLFSESKAIYLFIPEMHLSIGNWMKKSTVYASRWWAKMSRVMFTKKPLHDLRQASRERYFTFYNVLIKIGIVYTLENLAFQSMSKGS